MISATSMFIGSRLDAFVTSPAHPSIPQAERIKYRKYLVPFVVRPVLSLSKGIEL